MNLFATDGWRDSSNAMVATGEQPRIEIPTSKCDWTKRQKAFSLFQLLVELAMTVFIAGIVVPSLLRPGAATKQALAGSSLHMIKITGVTFLFTYKNIMVAIVGVLLGGAAAWVIETERPKFWLRHLFGVLHDWLAGRGFGSDAEPVRAKEDAATKNTYVVWEN
jgi:hypothetical protein